jgi:hypothetical protein
VALVKPPPDGSSTPRAGGGMGTGPPSIGGEGPGGFRRTTEGVPATLISMPDIAHELIGSFMGLWDKLRLSLCARWARQVYRAEVGCMALAADPHPHSESEGSVDWWHSRAALTSLLCSLKGLRELRLTDPASVRALAEALRAGHGRAIEVCVRVCHACACACVYALIHTHTTRTQAHASPAPHHPPTHRPSGSAGTAPAR